MPLNQAQQEVISILKRANSILVLPSSPLDADSIGSGLALYLALKKLGKKITVVAEEEIPESYNFLPQISIISRELNFVRDFIVTIDCRGNAPSNFKHEIQGDKINIIVTPSKGGFSPDQVSFSQGQIPYDCIVAVDAADPSQLGKFYEDYAQLWNLAPVINIDHHASNPMFGKINLVDIMASSTTTLVLPLIEELGQNLIDADIATLLLAGLITDTGSFQNPNTTPDAFAIAAKLIGYGARQQEIIRNIYKTKKLSTLRLWGRTLTKLQYDEKLKLVWSTLTSKDFTEMNGSPDETEGVIDELMSNAPGAEIVFLLKEKSPAEINGSIRTLTPSIDASKLAAFFGGGGHSQAAGFKIYNKSMQEAEKQVTETLKDFQQKRLGITMPTMTPMPAPIINEPIEPSSPRLIADTPFWLSSAEQKEAPKPAMGGDPFPPQPNMLG